MRRLVSPGWEEEQECTFCSVDSSETAVPGFDCSDRNGCPPMADPRSYLSQGSTTSCAIKLDTLSGLF